jgi:hypothetical protein
MTTSTPAIPVLTRPDWSQIAHEVIGEVRSQIRERGIRTVSDWPNGDRTKKAIAVSLGWKSDTGEHLELSAGIRDCSLEIGLYEGYGDRSGNDGLIIRWVLSGSATESIFVDLYTPSADEVNPLGPVELSPEDGNLLPGPLSYGRELEESIVAEIKPHLTRLEIG